MVFEDIVWSIKLKKWSMLHTKNVKLSKTIFLVPLDRILDMMDIVQHVFSDYFLVINVVHIFG